MKKKAFLIGINRYGNLPELKYACQDAEAVADSLQTNYQFSSDEITLLSDNQSSGKYIPSDSTVIESRLMELAGTNPDLFIFGFWGHGHYNDKLYMCPMSVAPIDVVKKGLTIERVSQLIGQIGAKSVFLILDCCQTLAHGLTTRGIDDDTPVVNEEIMNNMARDIGACLKSNTSGLCGLEQNYAIINSCTIGTPAYEWDERSHGLFTAHLLEAFDQRLDSSMLISDYLNKHVPPTAQRLGHSQQPFCKLNGYLTLPVVGENNTSADDNNPATGGNNTPADGNNGPADGNNGSAGGNNPATDGNNGSADGNNPVTGVNNGPADGKNPATVGKNNLFIDDPTDNIPDELLHEIENKLPSIPVSLVNLCETNATIEKAIEQIKEGSHPDLGKNLEEYRSAQKKVDSLTEKQTVALESFAEAGGNVESLKKWIDENPDISTSVGNARYMCPKEINATTFLGIVDLVRQLLQEKKKLEQYKQQYDQESSAMLDDLNQKKASSQSSQRNAFIQFKNQVIMAILSVMPGYDILDSVIPEKLLLSCIAYINQKKYPFGWNDWELFDLAVIMWKNDRPVARQKQKEDEIKKHEKDIKKQQELTKKQQEEFKANAKNSGCVQMLTKHEHYVESVDWYPNGRFLASGSDDGTIRIWDSQTGEIAKTIQGQDYRFYSVQWSPDGRLLASACSDNAVRIWEPKTGKCVKTLTGHTGAVRSVNWYPSCHYLASGSDDSTVRVWDVQTGECVKTYKDHTNSVRSVSWSPNGLYLASGGMDCSICVRNLRLGVFSFLHKESCKKVTGHTSDVTSVSWSHDSQWLASGSFDRSVIIWNPKTCRQLKTFKGHGSSVSSVCFIPKSLLVATASWDKTVRIWNMETGETERILKGHMQWIRTVSLSHDGRYLATGSDDKAVYVWEI